MADLEDDFEFDEHGIYREKGAPSHGSADQGESNVSEYNLVTLVILI